MKTTFSVLLVLVSTGFFSVTEQSEETISKTMQQKATALINSMEQDQLDQVMFPFGVEERFNWYYTPVKRKGVSLNEMNQKQKELTLDLLQTALSEQGFTKAQEIMWLENILRIVENRPENDDYRNPGKYLISIFGDPRSEQLWGWRFEGHHLSLNFSTLDNRVIGITPTFLGSNPAEIRFGEHKGKKVLKQEMELARDLMNSFTPAQQQQAVFSDKTFRDIVTTNKREAGQIDFEGIVYPEMNSQQQKLLDQLINIYFGTLEEPLADKLYKKLEKNGKKQLHFAWAGSLEPNQAYYYRIHNKSILIEFDNSQNNANHVHTVIRDLENDWGNDVLKTHYESGVHQH